MKDSTDSQWINCNKREIRVNNIKNWEQLEKAIVHRMDEIFPKMKRMTTTMILRQDKGDFLIGFMSRLQIAQDSVDWDNLSDETEKAADPFMRLKDDKF